jgi:glutamate synthase (NADPH/NADH) small chain
MEAEGTVFRTSAEVGVDPTSDQLRREFDAVVLAGGATARRDLPIPGRELKGVYQAMEYLPWANRVQQGDLEEPPITAEGKDVIIIGGGDTGADCLGTAHRQGARSVHQFEIMPRPPDTRDHSTPWPTYPLQYRVSSAHEEGGEREFSINTEAFVDDGKGNVAALRTHRVEMRFDNGRPQFEKVTGSEEDFGSQLVLLAMGFTGPEASPMLSQFGIELNTRGNVGRDDDYRTNVEGVFVAGDMGRGQSLIVWAIAEGRAAAAAVDRHLMGETLLPSPIAPTAAPLR